MTLVYDAEQLIPVMVDRIVERFNPVSIILFGSRGRGDARSDSDVDLLVVLDTIDNHHRAAVAVGDLLSDLPIPKDIIVTTPEEIERRGDVIGSVLRPALREGKIIHER